MICSRCLSRGTAPRALSSRAIPASSSPTAILTSSRKQFGTTSTFKSPPPPASEPLDASSTSTAPHTTTAPKKPTSSSKASTKPMSSCTPGTTLRGLNYFKNKTDPVALEDDEYPAWLWTVLGDAGKGRKGGDQGDGKGASGGKMELEAMLYSKSANARRIASKRLRKQAAMNPDRLAQKVPLYEQSVDLPHPQNGTAKDNTQAAEAREDLNRAMRKKRRKDIKEGNFLKAMR